MRVFLRTKKAGLYYYGPGELGVGFGGALEFASVPAAARHAISEQLPDMEIVLRCDCLDREVPLSVMPMWCDLDRDHRPSVAIPTPLAARLPSLSAPAEPPIQRGDGRWAPVEHQGQRRAVGT
jgi:hypothetical protein